MFGSGLWRVHVSHQSAISDAIESTMKKWWRCQHPVLSRNLEYLVWLGCWPPDDRRWRALFFVRFPLLFGPQALLCFFQLLQSAFDEETLSGLSSNLGHISSEMYLVHCLGLITWSRHWLKPVVKDLDGILGDFLRPDSHPVVRSTAESVIRVFSRAHYVLLVLCLLQGPFVMALPLIRFALTNDRKLLFVMKVWSPVSANDSTPYNQLMAMAVVHSLILGSFSACFGALNSVVFNVFLGVRGGLKCVAAQFRALGELGPRHPDLGRLLIETADKHRRVLAAAHELNHIFRGLLLTKVLNILLMSIFGAFHVVQGLDNLPYFSVQFILEGFNFFILCLVGNEIIEESKAVHEALLEVPHVGASRQFRRDLVFIMTRTQKPATMRIGRYSAFSMHVFIWVMRTAYSYYTVLQALT